jgi:glycosyltransferase involved in cell wall biosynthesis
LRVLHVHSGNLYGGVEAILVTLARQAKLCPQMESHFALCFKARLNEELIGAGANVHQLGTTRIRHPGTVLRARRVLRELLSDGSFNLAICHSGWSQAVFGPVIRAAGLPMVSWLHHATGGRNWLDQWASRTTPALTLCNSEFTAKTVRSLYPNERAEVMYCPVANERAHSDSDRVGTRAEFQTPPEATVIIQVSRMEEWKGQALHLEALSRLKDLPNWVCWQVGGAQRPDEIQYLEELKRTADQLGIGNRVRFLGQRSDVSRLLAAADIHCQPNTGPEPFGIAFIEALYAGLPVITTAIGGAPEIVNDSCGVLVPPGDSAALAASLRLLIENPSLRLRLGGAGPERARKLCDPRTQMKRLNELLASTTDPALAI